MEQSGAFNLMGYIDDHFPGLGFGGEMLYQWPFGLKFNIGLEHVERANAIYNQAFRSTDRLVLIGEDGPWESDPNRRYSLFDLPRMIRSQSPPSLSSYSYQLSEDPDEQYTVTWAELPQPALDGEQLFQAIANQDHGLIPSVRGRVFILDPHAELLLHMYDDRGLDIIATSTAPLIPLHERFADWINGTKLQSN